MSDSTNKIIEKYYDNNQILYNLFWPGNSLHYGLWDNKTAKLKDAVINTNEFVCKCLKINEKDNVLDAGCGVGGTSIYIAEKHNARVFGITLSNVQLKIADKLASKYKVSELTNFSKQDFTRTKFKGGSFSKIFGIESICHANNKHDFLKEAYRLLRKGGKIAVIDGFLLKDNLSGNDKYLYEQCLRGWAVPSLSTKEQFYIWMKKAGFKNIRYHDKLHCIKKSMNKVYKIGIMTYPFTYLLSLFRLIPMNIHLNSITCIKQKRVLEKGIATYGAFVAEK